RRRLLTPYVRRPSRNVLAGTARHARRPNRRPPRGISQVSPRRDRACRARTEAKPQTRQKRVILKLLWFVQELQDLNCCHTSNRFASLPPTRLELFRLLPRTSTDSSCRTSIAPKRT